MTSSPDRLLAWLALLRAPGSGPRTLNQVLTHSPDPEALFARPPAGLPTKLAAYLRQPDWPQAERDLAWLQDGTNRQLVTLEHPAYPPALREIPDSPPALFTVGDPEILALPQIAIVGSRNPTAGGLENAREFARELSTTGLTVTSGLALGIDGQAHQGALDAGGLTIAVTATGPDRVYPARHRQLAHAIVEQGAMITEFPPGFPAKPGHFPKRNRLISGLAQGVLVVEAALDSGSLITARLALEQGREVFAIPGSIHNPLARGCHALLRQGAKLVESAADILEELGPGIAAARPSQALKSPSDTGASAAPDGSKILKALAFDPLSPDQIADRTGLAIEKVNAQLLLLELEGHVSSLAGGHYQAASHTSHD